MDPRETDVFSGSQYGSAIQLLRLMHDTYRQAGEELRNVVSHFSEREAMAAQELMKALGTPGGTRGRFRDGPDPGPDLALAPRSGRQQDPTGSPAQRNPLLEVCCLGIFAVRVDSVPIRDWRSQKAKSLLSLLVERRGRPSPREMLMEALWPGTEPSLANNNLKSTARALRQILGSVEESSGSFSWLLFRDGSYLLNPEAVLWTDVDQFEYRWRAARKLEREGKLGEAMQEYETAEAQYTGDYLEDNPYEEWTAFRREALKDTYLAVLQRLANNAMQRSDYEGCISCCQKILSKDRCREDAYQRLMCCHSRLGQRSRAIGWYRICEKTMREDLDLCPEAQTTHLHEELLKGRSI